MSRDVVGAPIAGLLLGFALSRIGFASWDEVQRMFRFEDLRLTLTFALAVAVLVPAWLAIARATSASWPQKRFHRGTLIGGALFGLGWALCGACPGIALVQVGEGRLGALVTLAGILAGNWLYALVHARWLRWPTASCSDE